MVEMDRWTPWIVFPKNFLKILGGTLHMSPHFSLGTGHSLEKVSILSIYPFCIKISEKIIVKISNIWGLYHKIRIIRGFEKIDKIMSKLWTP